jgi:exodeoxyribonuclease VII small subunit
MAEMDVLLSSLDQPVEKLDYEQAYNQLEEIVEVLEAGDYTLEISMRLFERGQILASYCAVLLDRAELKVQQVSGEALAEFETQE